MNKKGQSLGLSIMSFISIIIVGFLALNFLTTEVTQSRIDLACSDAENIEDGNKLLCLVVNAVVPYWIWIILTIAVGAITVRYIL